MAFRDWFLGFLGIKPRRLAKGQTGPEPATHVIIIDGTLSSLRQGHETNAGLAFKMLQPVAGRKLSLYYEAGLQWRDWRTGLDVLTGRGINDQICRAYGVLASRYQPGDRIYLIGYSRGAYAVRSLAGIIDLVGLVRAKHALPRHIATAFRHYKKDPNSDASRAFAKEFCHAATQIEAIGVWDTVKALGIRLPILWRFSDADHRFHSARLGQSTKIGFQALALDETRIAYRPELWDTCGDRQVHAEQMWFRGNHGDVGGQIYGDKKVRALSNLSLIWIMKCLVAQGLPLPQTWQDGIKGDAHAPSSGNWSGSAIFFLLRGRRVVARDPSEILAPDVPADHWAVPKFAALERSCPPEEDPNPSS